MSKMIDLTGQKFGRLTVIKHDRYGIWTCKCDCGNESHTSTNALTTGNAQSCGCRHKEIVGKNSTKHGLSKTRLYSIFRNMKCRCYTLSASKYEIYGGRGIKICDEWLTDFLSFYNWAITNDYSDELSIDRINSNDNYEPSNCRWATSKVQNNNTNQNHVISYKGKSQTLAEWADELKLSYKVLSERIRRKWSIERAFNMPTQYKGLEVGNGIKTISN